MREPSAEASKALRSLRLEIASRGLCRKAPARVIGQLVLHLILALSGFALLIGAHVWSLHLLGLLISTIGTTGVATNTHTSSHNATSEKRWVNSVLTYFGYPFFLQLSATYWHQKHILRHHRFPNVLGVDHDIDWSPFFAITEDEMRRASRLRLFLYRSQWLIAPIALALNAFSIQVSSWLFVFAALRDRRNRQPGHWLDLGLMIFHWLLWIALPMIYFRPSSVLLAYSARMVMLGYALFAILAPAHFPAEAAATDSSEFVEYLLLQTATTVDFRGGVLGRIICSGLDHQIEHHLFPGVSHVNYLGMEDIVRAFCETHGYPYRRLGWGAAIWKSLNTFRRPKRVERDLISFASATAQTEGRR